MNSNIIVSLVEGLIKALLGFFIKDPKEAEVEKNVNVKVQEAVEARRKSSASVITEPDKLRDDDGFKRPD